MAMENDTWSHAYVAKALSFEIDILPFFLSNAPVLVCDVTNDMKQLLSTSLTRTYERTIQFDSGNATAVMLIS